MNFAASGLTGWNGTDALTFSGGDAIKLPAGSLIARTPDGSALVLAHKMGGPRLQLPRGLLAGIAVVAVWKWWSILSR